MKLYMVMPALALALTVTLAGCGSGPDRSALAGQTVHTYWDDLGHLRFAQAYALLSPGVQQGMALKDFSQNIIGFLQSSEGLSAKVHKVTVVGDCALVALGLQAPKAGNGQFNVFQSLYWLNGKWRITNPNGGTSRTAGPLTSCPTGT